MPGGDSDTIAKLRDRLRIERVVSSISRRLVAPEDLDGAIEEALGEVGRLRGASRVYLFRVRLADETMSNTHEWCADGVEPMIALLQDMPLSVFPWWMDKLFRFETIQIPDVSAMPPEAASEKDILDEQDIRSLLVLPLRVGDKLDGFVGFDTVDAAVPWDQEDIALLEVVTEILGRAIDATEARELARARQEILEQFDRNVGEVFWLFDWKEQRVLFASSAFEEVWGRPVEELYAHPGTWRESIHPDDLQYADSTFNAVAESSGSGYRQYRIVRPDGQVRWISDPAFAVRDASGDIVRIAGVATDITEARLVTERAVQAERLDSLVRLAGGISHDLNNIVMGISGTAELVLDRLAPGDRSVADLATVVTLSARAAELSRRMLMFSGGREVQVEPLDLGALVEGERELLRSLVPGSVELHIDVSQGDTRVVGNRSELSHLLSQLVANSSEAIGQGPGSVRVRVGSIDVAQTDLARAIPQGVLTPGRHVCLRVTDDGCGMDDDTERRMFDPFFSTRAVGRGLGLAVVHGIVRALGGALVVDSSREIGTAIRLFLPSTSEPLPSLVSIPPPLSYLGGRTVLVVDDEPVVLRLVTRIVRRAGYPVISVSGGARAIAIVREHGDEIGAVVLDLSMPEVDGGQAAQAISALLPDLPILVMSGYGEDQARQRLGSVAVVAFLQKPFGSGALRQALAAVLAPSAE